MCRPAHIKIPIVSQHEKELSKPKLKPRLFSKPMLENKHALALPEFEKPELSFKTIGYRRIACGTNSC